jgi:hypothetical protein
MGNARIGLCLASMTALFGAMNAQAGPISVTTYHYDNLRTGWNQIETGLTPRNVRSSNFKLIASTALDDQVDAQPLVLGNQAVSGHSAREVVYVATESNTIYAIDANNGQILLQRNFGMPVPFQSLPGGCNNNGPNIGINSTPVIDPSSNTIYVVTDTFESNHAVYRIHALDPATLNDTVTPVLVTASGTLSDGSTYHFNAFASRLRAALLVANGNVYAGFASYCDVDANQSRGWILGWQTGTLTPLASNELTNKLKNSTDDFFLTSIWMSGYGLASSVAGDIYFVTGNSDYSGDSYDKVQNVAESVVQLSPDLSTVKSLFTPMGSDIGWQILDEEDADFGSGGGMLLPPQPGQSANLLVAAGKVGVMYVLNADNLNNGKANGGKAFSTSNVGSCWCGPSYYKASDGFGRVVTSGGNDVGIWKVVAGGSKPKLVFKNSPGSVAGAQFPGFFTTVSSNGALKGTAVVWAVGRPTGGLDNVSLYAFDPDRGKSLFSGIAGRWPNTGGDSNIVPVVANSKVYVATNQSLAIFGLAGADAKSPALPVPKVVDMRVSLAPGQHEIYGMVASISGDTIVVHTRDGRTMTVDASAAAAGFNKAQPRVGHAMIARGTIDDHGALRASVVMHAKDHPVMWPADR